MLKIKSLEDFNLTFSALVFPWLEAGDVMEFRDPRAGDDEPTKFLLTSFDMPLSLGPMGGAAKRVTIVGNADTPVIEVAA
jgi:hypothetical protein